MGYPVAAIAAVALSTVAAVAAPVEVRFTSIDQGLGQDPASQFRCAITDVGHGVVGFTFTNHVGIASSIADIYFSDSHLLGGAALIQQGTDFVSNASAQPALPSWQSVTPGFQSTRTFSIDGPDNPEAAGISSLAQSLEIRFQLINKKTFDDTVRALLNGSLRIGIATVGIGTAGSSAGFLGSPTDMIPIPPAAWVGLSGLATLGAFAFLRRRRMRGF